MLTAEVYPEAGQGQAALLDLAAVATALARIEGRNRRRRRYDLATFQRRRTKLRSVRLCGTAIDDTVRIGVEAQAEGLMVAHVSGIARCKSPWACPVCAPTVRERRAREIDAAAAEALKRSWTVLMVSCTVPHEYADALTASFDTLRVAHRETRAGRSWQTVKTDLDYAGSVRCWEMTLGINGWHPHSHELLFFRRQLSDAEVEAIAAHYAATYGVHVERATGKKLHPVHGIDARRVQTAREVGSYLTKVDGGWGAGLELARADLKRSRGGRNPWDLLAGAADGEVGCLGAWEEYEAATQGKRAIQWSNGLEVELGVKLATDEEAAVVEVEDETVWEVELAASQWSEIRREGCIAPLLEECEDRAARRCGAGPGP